MNPMVSRLWSWALIRFLAIVAGVFVVAFILGMWWEPVDFGTHIVALLIGAFFWDDLTRAFQAVVSEVRGKSKPEEPGAPQA